MPFLSHDNGIEGVTRVHDISYMRILRASMRQLGAWPSRRLGEAAGDRSQAATRCFVFVVELANALAEFGFLRNNVGKLSFLEIGHTYITFMVTVVAVFRSTLTFSENFYDLFCDFVNKIHLFHFKEKSKYSMETHILVQRICNFFTIYLYTAVFTGVVLFNLTPLYNNVTSGAFSSLDLGNVTLQHSVYYALPFDYVTNYRGYFCVACVNWFMCYIISFCISTFDLIMSLVVFHVWGHLKILIHNIENFVKPKDMGATQTETCQSVDRNKRDFLKLRDIIIYHHLIIDFIAMMSQTFGSSLFIYYGFHQASGCLLLVECSQMTAEALLRYFPLTLVVFQQLIQLSIIFELLGAMTDKLVDAAYCLPWEQMDSQNQKIVYILLRQTQLSLNLKALDMVDVGVQTMTAILKTSFSYFVMLRAVATEE